MAKKIDYASLFTLRKDGRYQGSYTDAKGRHYVYDRDPERLWHRLNDLQTASAVTLKQAAEEWADAHRSQVGARTWQNYKPHIEDIVSLYGDIPVSDITVANISADLQKTKAKGYSATIVKTRLAIWNGTLNHAAVEGYTDFNPALMVKIPKNLPRSKRRAPTDDEIITICSNIDAPFGFFAFFVLCTGMRKGEALALTRSDIDFQQKEIFVNKAIEHPTGAKASIKPPKTESGNRAVPIIDVLVEPLKKHLATGKNDCIFPGKFGYLSKTGYDYLWRQYCEAVGFIDKDGKRTVTAHMLRHGTATLLFEAGVDVYTAQAILGHANVTTTMQIYTELREGQKRKSVKKFNETMSNVLSKIPKLA